MPAAQVYYVKPAWFLGSEYDVTGTVTVHYAWQNCGDAHPLWIPVFPDCPTSTKPIPLYPTWPNETGTAEAVNFGGEDYFVFEVPLPYFPCWCGWCLSGTDKKGRPRFIDGPRCMYFENPAPSTCECPAPWQAPPYPGTNECGMYRYYEIRGYYDYFFTACSQCTPDSGSAWGGIFAAYTGAGWGANPCFWTGHFYPNPSSISGRRIRDSNDLNIRIDGANARWVITIQCYSESTYQHYPIWIGYKYEGGTPWGTYQRNSGCDARGSITLDPRP